LFNVKKITMKKKIIISAFTFAALMFGACDNNNSNDGEATEQTESVSYQCPMKCEGEKTYEEPGKCPQCGMDLVKL
jgi:hypothetical protein